MDYFDTIMEWLSIACWGLVTLILLRIASYMWLGI